MINTPLNELLTQRKLFLAFVRRRVSDAALAEDILQNCYLRAFEHQGEFEQDESAIAWFYRLLRNAVIDRYRRNKSQEKALELLARELETSAQRSPELHTEACACLHDIIKDLKPEYSEALLAVDLGEQRVQDFAKQHNLSASNAGVRLHRARTALRKRLIQTCASCAEHGCLDCTCKKHAPSADQL
ncbi:RNA polymerase sigma factor [Granulicella aggregans]|jgi:RNA polymerase sigma-70 factor (ECF subfamily)|uniref:RNA polymerase sigma factor n=1 Tax=Granulicella aggregans TaxID=474949 RepID=UPI0021E07B5C|nr:sigma-70 family RNA polymerase sigma factor [Granulicella aggregans]